MNFYIKNQTEETVSVLSTDEVGAQTAVLSAIVDEKLSSYDELKLTIPADSQDMEYLKEDNTIVFEDQKGWREYLINYVEDVDSTDFEREITADLSSIELADEIIKTELSKVSKDPTNFLNAVLAGTRWTVGLVDSAIYSSTFSEETQFKSVLEVLDLMSSEFNCEVQFSYVVDRGQVVKRQVNLYKQFGSDNGKRFEIDKDVSSIKRTIDTETLKTAIIPYGKEPEEGEARLSIKDIEWKISNGDPADKPKGQDWLGSPIALANWGRVDSSGKKRHRFISMEIDVETESELMSMAWIQLARYTDPKITYESDVIDLYALTEDKEYEHEKVNLGDTVIVIDNYFSVPIQVITRIAEMARNLIEPNKNKIVFGDSKQLFSVSAIENRVDELNNKLNEVERNTNAVSESANGKNTNNYGSDEPTKNVTGDTWFRPHPTKPNETQMLIWDGLEWILELDTSKVSIVSEELEQVKTDTAESIKSANSAVEKADQAIEEAGFAKVDAGKALTDVNSITQTVSGITTRVGDSEGKITAVEQTVNGIQSTVANKAEKSQITQLAGQISTKVESEDYTSKMTQLDGAINLRATKSSLMSQLNLNPEGILLQGKNILLDGNVTMQDAFISKIKAVDISADRITAGTLNASNVSIINLNADNITAGILKGTNLSINLGTGDVLFQKGVIKSSDSLLAMDITNKRFESYDSNGGFTLENGAINLRKKPLIVDPSSANRSEMYGKIDYGNNFWSGLGMTVEGTDGLFLQLKGFSQTLLGSRVGSAGMAMNKGSVAVEAMNKVFLRGGLNYTNGVLPTLPEVAVGVDHKNSSVTAGADVRVSGAAVRIESQKYNLDMLPSGLSFSVGTLKVFAVGGDSFKPTFDFGGPLQHYWDSAGGYLRSMSVYTRTNSAAPNLFVTNNGVIGRSTSASKYKLNISEIPDISEYSAKLLSIKPKQWFDKSSVESYAEELSTKGKGRVDNAPITPFYGLIAEDLVEAGLEKYVQYGEDSKEVEGIMYDRLWTLLIPIVKQQKEDITDLKTKLAEMENVK